MNSSTVTLAATAQLGDALPLWVWILIASGLLGSGLIVSSWGHVNRQSNWEWIARKFGGAFALVGGILFLVMLFA